MNGISHKEAIQLIHRRLDGLLNESQRLSLNEHLDSCASCRAYSINMDGLSAHLQNEFHRRWDENSGPSQNVMDHVTVNARRIPITNRISSVAKLLAGAMTMIVLAVAINFVVSRLQSTSPATNETETVDSSHAEDRLLAFASDQSGNFEIYTMHADGSVLTNITNNPAYDGFPFWSPDGKRIAFTSDRGGSNQIYLINADGSNVIQLTTGEGDYQFDGNGRSPWSPDGKKLILSHASPGEQRYRLYVMDITDKSIIMLTNEPGHYIHPSWSPDGTHIAFTSDPGRIPQDLFVVGSDGNGLMKLTEDLPSGEFFLFDYEWSQDGKSLFFTTNRNHQVFQKATYTSTVYEASMDGSVSVAAKATDRRILNWWNGTALLDNQEETLTWLRSDGSESMLELCQNDGQILTIAYERSHTGNLVLGSHCSASGWMLYWSNPDGTMIKQLPNLPISTDEDSLFNLTWSPDDQYLAFTSVDTDSPYVPGVLYVLDILKAREDASIQPVKIIGGSPSWQLIINENLAEEIPTPQPKSIPNGLLAFTSDQNGNYDIYTMHPDSSGLTNITNNPADDVYPFWSPDGHRIAFTSNRDGSMQIYLMDADGSNIIQLTSGEGDYRFDVNGYTPWSPDGRKLIFVHKSPEEQNGKLYVIDIYEKTITSLTNEPGGYLLPSWSPNGKNIGFTEFTDGAPVELFIVGSDGTQLTKLTENLRAGEFVPLDYRWSQDGEHFIFITQGGTYSTVYTASPDGSLTLVHRADTHLLDWWNGTALVNKPGDSMAWLRADGSESTLELCQNNPPLGTAHKWSNRGNLLLASNCSDNEWMFYWANPDGTEIDQLLDTPISIGENSLFNPAWSLDDRYIAFEGNRTLYVLDVAKAREDPSIRPLKLTNSVGPSWQPAANQAIVEGEPTSTPTPHISEVLAPIGTGINNGEWIAFIGGEAAPDPIPANQDVYMIHPDGSGLVNLTQSPAHYYGLQWSPDGQHLLFLMENPSLDKINFVRHYVGVTESHGEVTRPISDPDHYGYSWSPNSDKIVFADSSSGNYDIYTVYADGRNDPKLTQLTDNPAQDVGFAWSPDGSQLAFQRLDGDKLSIYVMNEDGSNQHEVARGMGRVQLRWSMDGNSLYANSVYRGPTESQNSHIECEACVAKSAIYRIDLDDQSVQQIYYEEDPSKVDGWHLYDTPQNTLYFIRGKPQSFVGIWGTWFRADGNSLEEIGELDPHQTCKTTTGNILNEHFSPNSRFSIISNFCAGGFDLYLADREAPNPKQKFVHLLQLPLNTWGQGGDNATLPMLWSPDGRWLVYDDGNQSVYLLDIEQTLRDPTTEPVILFQSDSNLFMFSELAWQPKP